MFGRVLIVSVLVLGELWFTARASHAATTPAILMTGSNTVPACVTPERMMAFLRQRNPSLDPKFGEIAQYYQILGNTLGLRWDFAFFQMLIETNYLSFKRPNGQWGLVRPDQNNFAGLGAFDGNPGERFGEVSLGVLAHLQHILMYAGQRQDNAIAERTRKVQDWILPWAQGFNRPLTFSDLTKKWSPNDNGYAQDILATSERFQEIYCQRRATEASALGGPKCRVWTASYGGDTHVLVASSLGDTQHYTALAVNAQNADAELQVFLATYAKDGQTVGTFATETEALRKAYELCPMR